ncbi:serine protease [Elysia marginata]|uniref:Serine protease n=1 Tax=Elysia marginata TaxID=1093978 RepID=A0AAV4JKZ6_9GAST|nr:serine protease [Elysia marginata]
MTSSSASVAHLGRPSWPQLRVWSCVLLYWLCPDLACSDCRQLIPPPVPSPSSQDHRDGIRPIFVVKSDHNTFLYILKNDSLLIRRGYFHKPNELSKSLSSHSSAKEKLDKIVKGKELEGSLYKFSLSNNTIPLSKVTFSLRGLQRQSKAALLDNMQKIHKFQYSKLWDFCNAIIFNTLWKSLCSHVRFSRWLESNRSRRRLISNQVLNISANVSQKLRLFRPSVRLIQKRRHYRGKTRSLRPREEFVYGHDDRRKISPLLMRTFPYSNVVRLSTGCTGTLLTPLHVLTAAHCVHNGYGFRENLEMMRVEVPYPMGVRVFYIEKISIPSRWRHPRRVKEHQEAWDYAVVTLIYGVHGRSRFYSLAVSTPGMIENDLIFLAFMKEHNGQNHLWISKCPGPSNKPLVDRSLIFTHCDSAVGNSGAAILAKHGSNSRKIIGVLSSTIQDDNVRNNHGNDDEVDGDDEEDDEEEEDDYDDDNDDDDVIRRNTRRMAKG